MANLLTEKLYLIEPVYIVDKLVYLTEGRWRKIFNNCFWKKFSYLSSKSKI